MKVSTSLQTDFGSGLLHVYAFTEGYYIVFVSGEVEAKTNVLTRVHDQCLTADLFHSDHCDCRQQRVEALRLISQRGCGVFIYTPLEGRGQGLLAKIQQYAVQNALGLDTIAAAHYLGFSDDSRDYNNVSLILDDLGIKTITLLTNNPRKVAQLRQSGVLIEAVLPLLAEGLPERASSYVSVKQEWFGFFGK